MGACAHPPASPIHHPIIPSSHLDSADRRLAQGALMFCELLGIDEPAALQSLGVHREIGFCGMCDDDTMLRQSACTPEMWLCPDCFHAEEEGETDTESENEEHM